MNEHTHVDFFCACRSGFLAQTFVSLGKLLDRASRDLRLCRLRRVLKSQGFTEEADLVESWLSSHRELATRVFGIGNKPISHNEDGVTRDEVFVTYWVTPDVIRGLVEAVRTVGAERSMRTDRMANRDFQWRTARMYNNCHPPAFGGRSLAVA